MPEDDEDFTFSDEMRGTANTPAWNYQLEAWCWATPDWEVTDEELTEEELEEHGLMLADGPVKP